MEILSRYNYLLDSKRIGKFIYNSRTNSFIKLSNNLFSMIKKGSDSDISPIDQDIKKILREAKVLVEENEDDDYYYNKKFQKQLSSFSTQTLGLTIATTTDCNFRCPYCYEKGTIISFSNKENDDAIIKMIEKNNAQKVHITWYGGEPLLNFKSIRYITNILKNEYKNKQITYSITTNGYLLDKNKVNFFKNNHLESIQITIDGLKETNDKSRILKNGKGSFDIIIKNLTHAINELPKTKISIRVNIDKNNIHEFPKLYSFLKGTFPDNSNLHIYHSFIKDYFNVSKDCISHNNATKYNMLLAEKYNIVDFPIYPSYKLGGCVADSINGFVVDPLGNLYKCWVDIGNKDRIIGNISDKKDANINYNLLSRYIVASDMFSHDKCRKCFVFPVCNGGCPYVRITTPNIKQCKYMPKNIISYLELCYNKTLNKNQ